MSTCFHSLCPRLAYESVLYVVSDGVADAMLCQRHVSKGLKAANRLGGEPVYEMSAWLRIMRPGGRLVLANTTQRPLLLQTDEAFQCAGDGECLPLFETQPLTSGVVIATDERVGVLHRHRFVVAFAWTDVVAAKRFEPAADWPKSDTLLLYLEARRTGRFGISVVPQVWSEWQELLEKLDIALEA